MDGKGRATDNAITDLNFWPTYASNELLKILQYRLK